MKTKNKKKRLNKKKLIIFVLIFYILICIIYSSFTKPIKNIIIEGNELVKDSTIIKLGKIENYPPILTLSKRKLKKEIKKHELIEEIEIKKTLKYELIIKVKEKKVICEYENKYILSDNSKIDGKYIGTPTLINYVPENTLIRFLSNMKELNYDIINSISEIEYSPSKDEEGNVVDEDIFKFTMNDGNNVIVSIDRIYLMKKYQKIYASLGNKKGVLHLDKGTYLEVK